MSKSCGDCKFYAQDRICSYCEHPKQQDEGLQEYCYYTFGTDCKLFEKGISKTRVDYMKRLEKENESLFTKILKRLRLL